VPDVVPESVVLILPNETPAAEVTTDDGPWQVQPTTGEVVFTPTTAVQPVASPTAVTSTQKAAQTLPVVATAGDPLVPLDPAATRLEAPAGATVDADGTVVVVPGEGRYELDRTAGTVLFTPEPAFTGTATPVPYVVTDTAGATAASTLTPSMTEVARPDTSVGEQGTPQRLAVTENDRGAVPVSPATLRLVDPSGVDAATVVVPGEGTWTVDGEVLVFTPEPAFVGTATPVSYRVDTAAGDTVESTATPTVTAAPVVPPAPIVAVPDIVVTPPAGAPAVFDLPAAVPDLVPESVVLIQPNNTPATEFPRHRLGRRRSRGRQCSQLGTREDVAERCGAVPSDLLDTKRAGYRRHCKRVRRDRPAQNIRRYFT
jgi:CshA-type fibril repeat protein